MNRTAEPSPRCSICGWDMQARYVLSTSVADRIDLNRQILSGICDGCQRARQDAAETLISAADEIRVIWQLFTAAGRPSERGRDPFTERSSHHPMVKRLMEAERRCIELKMWPPVRTDRVPDRFVNSVKPWWWSGSAQPPPSTERENR